MELDYQRQHGIYYTPDSLAQVVCDWAIRSPNDAVLDPSYGGCAFLRSALTSLRRMGQGSPGPQLYGVDIDPSARTYGLELLKEGVPCQNLIQGDFLGISPEDISPVTAVIGNPPYVRHHYLDRSSVERAANTLARAGHDLTRRASYWAYFILHSIAFIAQGGRLALVLPVALMQAEYAALVRGYLQKSFETITLVLIHNRLFPDAEQESVLLLADGKGGMTNALRVVEVDRVDDIPYALSQPSVFQPALQDKDWRRSVVGAAALAIYESLETAPGVSTLGELGTIRIGAVTGANRFFIIDNKTKELHGIPNSCVRKIVTHSSDLPSGLSFEEEDAENLVKLGRRVLLVNPPDESETAQLRAYYDYGATLGVDKRFKCANRKPWYFIRDVRNPDAFLTYMISTSPRLIMNKSDVDCTNALHRFFWKPGVPLEKRQEAVIAVLSSITQLSAEILGRTYGGGVLKLEPRQAARLIIPPVATDSIPAVYDKVCNLLRCGNQSKATELVDSLVSKEIGLGSQEMDVVRREIVRLRNHRYGRRENRISKRKNSSCGR